MKIYRKQSLRGVPWNQLKLKDIKILYLLSALKELGRSTLRKHALLWNKHECQNSGDVFVENIFNLFHGIGLFLYYLKYIRKPEVS